MTESKPLTTTGPGATHATQHPGQPHPTSEAERENAEHARQGAGHHGRDPAGEKARR